MTSCHELKKGHICSCEGCGLELQVIKECKEAGTSEEACSCSPCSFVCCNEKLKLKK
jgi:hypothetical protein